MFSTNSIILEKNIEKKNGKITKNIEMLGYNNNGNVTIQGNINEMPFLITNQPEIENKQVRFMNTIKNLPNYGILSRTLTPLPKKSKKLAIKKIGDIAKRVKKQTRKNRKTKTKK